MLADPLKGQVLPFRLEGQYPSYLGEQWAQQRSQCLWLGEEGKQEVHTTHLGITEVIAGPAILAIVPANSVVAKVPDRVLADAAKEIMLGMLNGKTERSGPPPVDAVAPRVGRKYAREIPDGGLPLLLTIQK